MLGSNINSLLSARKDMHLPPASTKMKQLQWDKLPQQLAARTVFNDEEPSKEQEMLDKLQLDGVWMEMEEDFKAKQLVINLMGMFFFSRSSRHPHLTCSARQKRAELKSVLDPQTKKRVGKSFLLPSLAFRLSEIFQQKSSSNGSRNYSLRKLLGKFSSLIKICVHRVS
jgi:cytokinesis protein